MSIGEIFSQRKICHCIQYCIDIVANLDLIHLLGVSGALQSRYSERRREHARSFSYELI